IKVDSYRVHVLIRNQLVRKGFDFDDNGRMYIWEKRGKIWIVEEGEEAPILFLDIEEEVANIGDNGLMGFTRHPDFAQNGYIYVLYAVDRYHLDNFGTPNYNPVQNRFGHATIGRLTRYTADATNGFQSILPESRKILLGTDKEDGVPILESAHAVGTVLFGTDGSLIASSGDGSAWRGNYIGGGPPFFESFEGQAVSGGFIPPAHDVGSYRSQLLDSHNGKVFRLDPETGNGMPENPYFDSANPRSARSRTWAYGFRHGFRMALRPGTGEADPSLGKPGSIFLGDVGRGRWEEINVIRTPGRNYGWPVFEGMGYDVGFDTLRREHPFAPSPNCGATNLSFHDVVAWPDAYSVMYPDPCAPGQELSGDLPLSVHQQPAVAWGHKWKEERIRMPTFDENGRGSSYLLDDEEAYAKGDDFVGLAVTGVAFYNGNTFPEAYQGMLFVSDYFGGVHSFEFDLNDSLVRTQTFLQDTFPIVHLAFSPNDDCLYYVKYKVGGGTDEVRKICFGGNVPPTPVIEADTQYGPSPLSVQFKGDQSFDPQGEPFTLRWDFGDGSSSEETNPSHTFVANGADPQAFEISLFATDSIGQTSQVRYTISVNNTPPKVEITSLEEGQLYPPGGATFMPLEALVDDAEHGPDQLQYTWYNIQHHNTHTHLEEQFDTESAHAVIAGTGCGEEDFWYQIALEVQDAHGLSTYVRKFIYPDCGPEFVQFGTAETQRQGRQVAFLWETLMEDNVESFLVQRAPNESQFETIATVAAQSGGVYRYLDTQPLEGESYYRAVAVKSDGRGAYSPTAFSLVLPVDMRLYPNPFQDELTLEFDLVEQEATLELYDLKGRLMWQGKWPGNGQPLKVKAKVEGLRPDL
ncbi:MAG: PQQ-dependent sugar dehydrogenase, partial [Bacteroidota bacterium]